MQFQVLAASVEELREAYQVSLSRLMEAKRLQNFSEALKLESESEMWRHAFLERLAVLSASIGDRPTNSGTDAGKQ